MKNLILYFSRADENYFPEGMKTITKGNTEQLAETLKNLTDADIFKVEPAEAYPANYRECCDLAQDQLLNGARPALKNQLKSLDGYDTIYLLSPVWWSHLPVALMTQLEALDWQGKTINLITTHEGSGLGDTERDVTTACAGATLNKTLAIAGHAVATAGPTLENWLAE